MKTVLVKELGRAIWKTKTRFLSILAIIAVGTGFFAGVKSSCPDMKLTAETYFKDARLMDIHLVSTLGFTEEDIAAVKDTGGIRGMMPAYSTDAFVKAGEDANLIVTAHSLPANRNEADENYLNRPQLIEGRLPEKADECLVEEGFFTETDFKIGSTITFFSEKDTDIKDTLKTDTFTIVGVVNSPSYISFTRGNSLIGDGVVDAYVILPEEAFSYEVYTDVYLTLDSTKDLSPFVDRYDELIEEKATALEQIADIRAQTRYDEIKDEAQAEIDKAKQELADGEKTAEQELADAKKKLDDAKKQLDKGQKEYDNGLTTLEKQESEGRKKLSDAKKELSDGQREYESGLAQYQEGLAAFEAGKPAAEAELKQYEQQAKELEKTISDGKTALDGAKQTVVGINGLLDQFAAVSIKNPADFPDQVKQVIAAAAKLSGAAKGGMTLDQLLTLYIQADGAEAKAPLKAGIQTALDTINTALNEQQEELETGEEGLKTLKESIAAGWAKLNATEDTLAATKKQLDDAKHKLDTGTAELEKQEKLLEDGLKSGREELASAKQELTDGWREYNKGLAEYNDGKAESDAKLADTRQQIKDAETELAKLAEPTWYVWDRNNNPGYSGYQEDAEKVDAIASVFPVFFVLVAALVCLTTMTRMVEEERTQIGTLKAIGYSRGSIILKYLAYAVAASIAGSAIGLGIGFQLFPRVIISAYGIMYAIPGAITPFRWDYAAACTLVAVLCTSLAALAACYKVLLTCPAQLMRPRAPKSGKRVLLEHVHFVWNKLSFIHKVTIRNIFRYKRRVSMAIIGVAGCTALLLTGFGLKYSITSIADKQYGGLFVYDAAAMAEDDIKDSIAVQEKISGINGVAENMRLLSKSMDATDGKVVKSASLYVPAEPQSIDQYIVLQERIGKKKLSLSDEGVIINEKLGKQLHLGIGDELTLNNPDGRPVKVKITGITENYAMNYVYMTPALYEEKFMTKPVYNMFLINTADGADSSAVSEALLETGDILGVSFTSEGLSLFNDMLKSLNSVIWVLIISAGTLAVIVMYNLVNINVNERVRELATIKVLGFYDKEVSAYIYRENNIAALMGILVGLVGGIFLERFVITTAEIDAVMFAPDISPSCFLYAALLTVLFTLIVNITLHFQLKKIDMVESLKSVE